MPVWCLNATKTRVGLFGLLMLLAAPLLAQSLPGSRDRLFDQPRFLPVDEAFRFYTSLDSHNSLTLHWQIAAGYYLYQDKFSVTAQFGDGLVLPLSQKLPEGEAHHDEYFGDVNVYYHEMATTVSLPARLPANFVLQLEYQGCAEAGLCYPPQQRDVEILRGAPEGLRE